MWNEETTDLRGIFEKRIEFTPDQVTELGDFKGERNSMTIHG